VHWREKAELRPAEVAKVSGRSLRTIRRKIADGALPSRLADGVRLVPVRAVLELVGEIPSDSESEPTVCAAQAKARAILADLRVRGL
jgi:hypothetical protein